ncbi:hypothetical protein [Catenulispora acidiphila]|nr:hypothetical protein [Catenulispora acidiphila]
MDQRDTQSGLPFGTPSDEPPQPAPSYAPPYAPPQRASFYVPPQRMADKPTVRRRTAIIGSAGGLVLGIAIGAAGGGTAKTGDTAAGTPPAAKTTAAPIPTVVFSTSGNGIKKTASFTTGPEWFVTYTFDCSNEYGGKGNFILGVDTDFGGDLADSLAAEGGDTSYEHGNPGSHYLSVNSECDWTLKVSND